MNRNTKQTRRTTTRSRARANEAAAPVEKPTPQDAPKPARKRAKGGTGTKTRAGAKQTHDFVQGKGFVPSGSIAAAAKKVKATKKARSTPKKAAPERKRVETPQGTLNQAQAFLEKLIAKGEQNKVGVVRELALWHDQALQRRDVIQLVQTNNKDLKKMLGSPIADATIFTQFQFARSGKERQNA